MSKNIYLGGLVKAFGIRGEVKFHPAEDFWEGVLESKRLVMHANVDGELRTQPLVIERSRPHGRGSYVVKIEGIEDRNAAEAIVGGEVFVDESELDVSLPDTLLPYQVIGLSVRSEAGETLGEIRTVVYSPAHDIYEVAHDDGTFMVPAIPEFIVSVDFDAGAVTVRMLPGLMDAQ
jgi:16S rRNA processing protein RimM